MTVIEPSDARWHNKPLWVVFGHQNEPSILPCVLRAYDEDHRMLPDGRPGTVVIWGYSVWRQRPGYRTYGLDLSTWVQRSELEPVFFDSHDDAIERIRSLTTVPVSVLRELEGGGK